MQTGLARREMRAIVSVSSTTMEVFPRITVEPDKCAGKPCIRGFRLTVEHVLSLLAEGMTHEQILAEWDFLEPEDIQAVLRFASHLASERSFAIAS
jgi:uncharacterized protein (DUF433 family)